MKVSVFSLSTDGSNDQNLKTVNPVTVSIFDINQHKVVTKFRFLANLLHQLVYLLPLILL